MSEQIHQEPDEMEERQLCVSCMAANDPSANFCAKCGAPLTSYASTGPFESVLAEGAVYRQAAERPRRLIVVVGVWLIFGSLGAAGLVLVGVGRDSGLFPLIIGAGLFSVSFAMIWRTTRNYLSRKKPEEERNA